MNEETLARRRTEEEAVRDGHDRVAGSVCGPVAMAEAVNDGQPGLLRDSVGDFRPRYTEFDRRPAGFEQPSDECIARR